MAASAVASGIRGILRHRATAGLARRVLNDRLAATTGSGSHCLCRQFAWTG